MKKMRVCVVTGTRAEFGIWRPVLRGIEASKVLELKLVVTGMHLLGEFGGTVRDIEEAGFGIAARVPMYGAGSRKMEVGSWKGEAAGSLARGIEGLAGAYREVGAELVMVLGDRLEMLAAACAALAERVPLAHVHGGETAPGIWDEQIRHAITKMAQVHFCATSDAYVRLLKMGEAAKSVHRMGAPALDSIAEFLRSEKPRSSEQHDYALVVLHPSSTDEELEEKRALGIIEVLRDLAIEQRVIGSNNDPGYKGILRAYDRYNLDVKMSVSQTEFWRLLRDSKLLIGNSSAGIIEASSFGVPVINVGGRQAGRERNRNVIDVPWGDEDGWTEELISRAVLKTERNKAFQKIVARRKNVYGDGKASARIVRVLEKLARVGGVGLEKRFCD